MAQRDFAWDYDAIGNRTQFRLDGAWAVNYHPNVRNQYSQLHEASGGQWARDYDEDGNLLLHEGVGNYHWDAENRLIKVESQLGTVHYGYDAQGRRQRRDHGTQTTHYIYDGWNVIAELGGKLGVQRSHLWGADLSGSDQGAGGAGGLLATRIHSDNTTHVMADDANGNITAAYNAATGQQTLTRSYDAFGKILNETGPTASQLEYGFSTKPRDPATALLYYGYRHYDPQTGRWLNRDPIEEQGGLNLYAFVHNNGVNKWDYLGLEFVCSIKVNFTEKYRMEEVISDDFWGRLFPPQIMKEPPRKSSKASGHIVAGIMKAYDNEGKPIESWYVANGGYRTEGSKVPEGQDTRIPSGSYFLKTAATGKTTGGYEILNVPNRSYIMIHGGLLSKGCIVTTTNWNAFVDLMSERRSKTTKNVPINISGDPQKMDVPPPIPRGVAFPAPEHIPY